jgi:hypothetical protein
LNVARIQVQSEEIKMKTPRHEQPIYWMARSVFSLLLLTLICHAAAAQTNTFPSSGNVGVGTTSPTVALDVVNFVAAGTGTARFKNTNANTQVIIDSAASQNANLRFDNNATPVWYLGNSANNDRFRFLNGNANGNAEVFSILQNGNVGIGTTGPVGKLEVAGSIYSSAPETNTVFNGLVGNNNAAVIGPQGYWAFRSDLSHRFNLDVYNSGSPLAAVTVNQAGNVGIATTSPQKTLHVVTDLDSSSAKALWIAKDDNLSGLRIGYHQTNNYSEIQAFVGGSADKLILNPSGGNVGIGTSTPNSQYKLDVAGNINSSATITGNNIAAKYQDVAEWVPSSEQLPAGTVVVLDSNRANEVIASSQAYDTRVAGVISAQPGISLGEKGDGKVLVATTGRVRLKVDATRAPIQIGDLLVTSDVPGFAMKSEAVNLGGVQIHRPGTLIGKALEPLARGSGEILVLLGLQ